MLTTKIFTIWNKRSCLLLRQAVPKGCIRVWELSGHSLSTPASGLNKDSIVSPICSEGSVPLLPLYLVPSPWSAGSFAFITSEYLILAARAQRSYILSLDKAQISFPVAMRPRQLLPCIARNLPGCGMLPTLPAQCHSQLLGLSALPMAQLSSL